MVRGVVAEAEAVVVRRLHVVDVAVVAPPATLVLAERGERRRLPVVVLLGGLELRAHPDARLAEHPLAERHRLVERADAADQRSAVELHQGPRMLGRRASRGVQLIVRRSMSASSFARVTPSVHEPLGSH